MTEALARTPLHDLHVRLGARLVPFAGYEMPVQYPTGIIAEHNWTRSNAGLFDVSHMGQYFIAGPDFQTSATALEKLVPADILGLAPWQQRYSQLLNQEGGILDDLMITRSAYPGAEGRLYVVVNASRKEQDFAHIANHLPSNMSLTSGDGFALLALQGPKAEAVLADHAPSIRDLNFMQCGAFKIAGMAAHVTRSGYTGEDGFEISAFAGDAAKLWSLLLLNPDVKPIGLGARDSLRLEAGLCLHGHDIDETTSPVEAGLIWSIGKRRRAEGGFMGDQRVLAEIAKGPSRKRVGIKPEGRAPAREGAAIFSNGRQIGAITSGGFGPTINAPIAMGYVVSAHAAPGTALKLIVRDRELPATVAALPFVPHNYKR